MVGKEQSARLSAAACLARCPGCAAGAPAPAAAATSGAPDAYRAGRAPTRALARGPGVSPASWVWGPCARGESCRLCEGRGLAPLPALVSLCQPQRPGQHWCPVKSPRSPALLLAAAAGVQMGSLVRSKQEGAGRAGAALSHRDVLGLDVARTREQ